MTLDAWTLEQIRDHIAAGIPLVPLFNITIPEASTERGDHNPAGGAQATGTYALSA